jgi:hypothetical protein
MDKIFSARVDESVIALIGHLSRLMHTSKKKILEDAIETYASKIEQTTKQDIFIQTHGIWQRNESPSETVKNNKKMFGKSMTRHSS